MPPAHALRNYLQSQPLVDWLDRYGVAWLHRDTTPRLFRDGVTDVRIRAGCNLVPSATAAATATGPFDALGPHGPLGPPSLPFVAFHRWLLAECAARSLGPPVVFDYRQAAAVSMGAALARPEEYSVFDSVLLHADDVSVAPVALVSGSLAAHVLGPYRPTAHAHTPFAAWVAVFTQGGAAKDEGKGGLVTATYDGLRCHVVQHALSAYLDGAWGGTDATTARITGVLLDVKHPSRSRVWLRTDKPYPRECTAAVAWQHAVREKAAASWDPLAPGDRLELCAPTGANVPERWRHVCEHLLHATDDICRVHQVGATARAKAWALGARTYHDLWTMQLTLGPIRLPPLALKMAWANHRDNPVRGVVPRTLKQRPHCALVTRTKTAPWFVVDFETLQAEGRPWIFMVATVFVDPRIPGPPRVFTHRMSTLTTEAQVTMLRAWVDEMRACLAGDAVDAGNGAGGAAEGTVDDAVDSVGPSLDATLAATPVLHWSSAEPGFLRRLFTKSPDVGEALQTACPAAHALLTNTRANQGVHWCDLYALFRKEPITVAGCFDFKLKHVVKALVALGKLSPDYVWAVEGPQDGRAAMARAEYGYATGDATVFADIVKYNEADVLVLWAVVIEVLWGMVG